MTGRTEQMIESKLIIKDTFISKLWQNTSIKRLFVEKNFDQSSFTTNLLSMTSRTEHEGIELINSQLILNNFVLRSFHSVHVCRANSRKLALHLRTFGRDIQYDIKNIIKGLQVFDHIFYSENL